MAVSHTGDHNSRYGIISRYRLSANNDVLLLRPGLSPEAPSRVDYAALPDEARNPTVVIQSRGTAARVQIQGTFDPNPNASTGVQWANLQGGNRVDVGGSNPNYEDFPLTKPYTGVRISTAQDVDVLVVGIVKIPADV